MVPVRPFSTGAASPIDQIRLWSVHSWHPPPLISHYGLLTQLLQASFLNPLLLLDITFIVRRKPVTVSDNLGSIVVGVITLVSASNSEIITQEITEIHFKIKERGTQKLANSLTINSSDTRELKRVMMKYMRKKINICDKND